MLNLKNKNKDGGNKGDQMFSARVSDIFFRFLRTRHRPMSGISICASLRLPISHLAVFDSIDGIGGFGPAGDNFPIRWQAQCRYAKRNSYYADLRGIFFGRKRIYCIKQRTLRTGKFPPKVLRKIGPK